MCGGVSRLSTMYAADIPVERSCLHNDSGCRRARREICIRNAHDCRPARFRRERCQLGAGANCTQRSEICTGALADLLLQLAALLQPLRQRELHRRIHGREMCPR